MIVTLTVTYHQNLPLWVQIPLFPFKMGNGKKEENKMNMENAGYVYDITIFYDGLNSKYEKEIVYKDCKGLKGGDLISIGGEDTSCFEEVYLEVVSVNDDGAYLNVHHVEETRIENANDALNGVKERRFYETYSIRLLNPEVY